jgi:cell division protease FtsH
MAVQKTPKAVGARNVTEEKPPRRLDRLVRLWRTRRALVVLLASLAVLLALYAAALIALRPASPGRQLSLNALVQAANDGNVDQARLLDQDSRVVGSAVIDGTTTATEFWTSYPSSDAATNDLLQTLVSSGTEVSVETQATKATVRFVAQFLLPLVILADLFALLFFLSRGSGGGAGEFVSFSKLGDRRSKGSVETTFADVAGSEEAIVELSEVRDYLADPGVFARMGALPPKGVLVVGPPGCGKTLLARAVAGEAGANFFSISGSEFVESLVGVGAARVRDLFRQAREAAPSIIFIDEIDAVGRQRGAGLGGGHDEREQTLNELLVQMDGFSPTEGVSVLAATNRVDILDPALLRAGRFDRHVTVERPDTEGRLAILRLHARSRRLSDPDRDLPIVARATPGFTGADLANVLNEAALLAVRERSGNIVYHHLEEAVERVLSGPKRKARIISPTDKRRIAYHEAGHAVLAAALGKAGALQKLSVVARGRGVGHLAVLSEDRTVFTRSDMEAQVSIAMAGVVAEELIFGEPSTGAESDLERATNIARDMAGRYGMTRLGRVRVLQAHGEVFLGRDYLSSKEVSQPTLETLDTEVARILEGQADVAHTVLVDNQGVLDTLASALIAQETLQGADLEAAVSNVRPYLPAPDGQGDKGWRAPEPRRVEPERSPWGPPRR